MNRSPDSWPHAIYLCIPSYQAAPSLAALLPELLEAVPKAQICIVDDGSTDSTKEFCTGCGVRYLNHSKNIGKGAALATGFAALLAQGAEAVITMDADGQHAVDDLGGFLDDFAAHPETGICIGKRTIAKSGMPLARVVSNTLTSRILSWMCSVKIHDSQCGFRLYSARFLRSVTVSSPGFAMESEVLLKAARLGFPLRSVEVQTLYFNGASHIAHIPDTLRWIKTITEIWLRIRNHGISEPPHRG
jgi:glycosyltransferase involved in cell wall biosynthesis